jgi:hypothetical protein
MSVDLFGETAELEHRVYADLAARMQSKKKKKRTTAVLLSASLPAAAPTATATSQSVPKGMAMAHKTLHAAVRKDPTRKTVTGKAAATTAAAAVSLLDSSTLRADLTAQLASLQWKDGDDLRAGYAALTNPLDRDLRRRNLKAHPDGDTAAAAAAAQQQQQLGSSAFSPTGGAGAGAGDKQHAAILHSRVKGELESTGARLEECSRHRRAHLERVERATRGDWAAHGGAVVDSAMGLHAARHAAAAAQVERASELAETMEAASRGLPVALVLGRNMDKSFSQKHGLQICVRLFSRLVAQALAVAMHHWIAHADALREADRRAAGATLSRVGRGHLGRLASRRQRGRAAQLARSKAAKAGVTASRRQRYAVCLQVSGHLSRVYIVWGV